MSVVLISECFKPASYVIVALRLESKAHRRPTAYRVGHRPDIAALDYVKLSFHDDINDSVFPMINVENLGFTNDLSIMAAHGHCLTFPVIEYSALNLSEK